MQWVRVQVLAYVLTVLMVSSVMADVPTNMNVQGRLTDGSGVPVPPGLRIFTFKIFDAEVGGGEKWPGAPGEDQTLFTDDNGLWNAQIGKFIPLDEFVFTDTSLWLEVTVDDGVNPPETLSRIKLNTSPFTYRSALSQQADTAFYAQSTGFAFNASNADNLGGQPAGSYALSGHGHNADYVNVTGDVMTGDLETPSVQLGNPGLSGRLELYASGSGSPVGILSPGWGDGGVLWLYDEGASPTAVLGPDGDGAGGFLQVGGGDGGSPGLFVNGMASLVDSGIAVTIGGPSSSSTFNTNNSGDNSVFLPSDAVSAPEILDEPGIAANTWVGSHNISQKTTMQTLVAVTMTTPADGYIVVEGECYAILSGTTGDNRVISTISEGGSDISPWLSNDGLKAYSSTQGGVFTISHRRWYSKPAGTYTFYFRARHIGSAPASAVLWYSKVIAQYFPTSYGSVVTTVSAEEATGFEQAELIEAAGGDDASGKTTRPPMYQVDLRELEIRALKARAEAERLERELMEAREVTQNEAMNTNR